VPYKFAALISESKPTRRTRKPRAATTWGVRWAPGCAEAPRATSGASPGAELQNPAWGYAALVTERSVLEVTWVWPKGRCRYYLRLASDPTSPPKSSVIFVSSLLGCGRPRRAISPAHQCATHAPVKRFRMMQPCAFRCAPSRPACPRQFRAATRFRAGADPRLSRRAQRRPYRR
jgi:hypothetical protein